MSDLHLHILSFDIPYPPNYGGVIDVFHKIRALHGHGVKIHLHCFQYNREPADELAALCHTVNYYPRKTGFLSALSWKPYIVYSRRSKELLLNLTKDSFPVLFEGLHSCYYLDHPLLADRFLIYRESNIEHLYYFHLFKAENNPVKKLYFLLSSLKLRTFQKTLRHASLMLTVSSEDNAYLAARFEKIPVKYLPSFHADDVVNSIPGYGDFILYQGNLSVPENIKAVGYLICKVFQFSDKKFVIAGLNPAQKLVRLCAKYPNVSLIPNPSGEEMQELIRQAHINIMVTFQPTGLKLKLLNALFNGRFCLVNQEMVAGTELGPLCETGSTPEEILGKINKLFTMRFDEQMIFHRETALMKCHSNKENCNSLLNLLPLLSSE